MVNNLRLEDEEDRPLPEIVRALVRRSRTMAPRLEISLEVGEQVPRRRWERPERKFRA